MGGRRMQRSSVPPCSLVAFEATAACRFDCPIFRCGDGILNGGEVCDDRITTSGDGCSVNCRSLFDVAQARIARTVAIGPVEDVKNDPNFIDDFA